MTVEVATRQAVRWARSRRGSWAIVLVLVGGVGVFRAFGFLDDFEVR